MCAGGHRRAAPLARFAPQPADLTLLAAFVMTPTVWVSSLGCKLAATPDGARSGMLLESLRVSLCSAARHACSLCRWSSR